jgi:tRNA(Arg) A34 adenosine deaminase TadA
MINRQDELFLYRAIEVSKNARQNGNHPFGAVLVNNKGQIIQESENTVNTGHDVTNHAETNLVRAAQPIDKTDLAQYTLYSSCEPCSMCSGAIYWAGIRRVVYALNDEELNRTFISETSISPLEDLNKYQQKYSCRKVFEMYNNNPPQVAGPALIKDALAPHIGFWKKLGKPNPQIEIVKDEKLSLQKLGLFPIKKPFNEIEVVRQFIRASL